MGRSVGGTVVVVFDCHNYVVFLLDYCVAVMIILPRDCFVDIVKYGGNMFAAVHDT